MLITARKISFTVLAAVLLVSTGCASTTGGEAPQGMMALAAPLAQQFGVPVGPITSLLDSGVSLESVTQLLLISQSSNKGLDEVTSVFNSSKQNVDKTAAQLKVAASDYSADKVSSAIDSAKAKLEADTRKAAADGANKAVDSVLGEPGR